MQVALTHTLIPRAVCCTPAVVRRFGRYFVGFIASRVLSHWLLVTLYVNVSSERLFVVSLLALPLPHPSSLHHCSPLLLGLGSLAGP